MVFCRECKFHETVSGQYRCAHPDNVKQCFHVVTGAYEEYVNVLIWQIWNKDANCTRYLKRNFLQKLTWWVSKHV